MIISQFWNRVMGLSGILGGLVLFAGDMFLYYDSLNTNLIQNMGHSSDMRIIASGITALIATWLYLIGIGQIYFAFKPSSKVLRNTVIICFGCILTSYGIIHAAYTAIATSAKLSTEYNIDIKSATLLASEVNNSMRLIIYPIFAVLSVVFIHQVWKRKTLYPIWIILFFPLIPFLLQGTVCKLLHGKAWVIICGGYLNLIIVIFFTASSIALWNKKFND